MMKAAGPAKRLGHYGSVLLAPKTRVGVVLGVLLLNAALCLLLFLRTFPMQCQGHSSHPVAQHSPHNAWP